MKAHVAGDAFEEERTTVVGIRSVQVQRRWGAEEEVAIMERTSLIPRVIHLLVHYGPC